MNKIYNFTGINKFIVKKVLHVEHSRLVLSLLWKSVHRTPCNNQPRPSLYLSKLG